jgi:Protein metal binding site.
MIVWGGGQNLGYYRSGGRLRFDTLPDVDADQDGASACGADCNDSNAAVHPGAVESCNLFDDNCAGGFDEDFDADLDGYAYCADCNDSNPAINLFAPDICNHIDDNCNNFVDDGSPDADGDSWASCLDCNDGNRDIYPGATEVCNGLDDDCDTVTDEGGDALCYNPFPDCRLVTCGGVAQCQTQFLPTGTPCDDGNACSQTSACASWGQCVGSEYVVCTAPDDCHYPGSCYPATGLCINQGPKPNGSVCNDGNLCTTGELCTTGVCGGGAPKDADSDTHVDAACGGNDCNDSNALVWYFPLEVTNLALTTAAPADPSWDNQGVLVGPETLYDLTSGMLTGSGGLDTASATCLAPATGSSTYSDSRPDPAAGTGFWYLTRARNSCGIGTYGFASNATERSIPACP